MGKIEASSQIPYPLLPEWAVNREQATIQKVLVMDVGSTNIKFAYWDKSQDLYLPDAKTQDTTKFQNIHFKDRISEVKVGDLPGFKVADGDQVLAEIGSIVDAMERANGYADMYTLTGFTNSLAVSYEVFGQKKTFILTDDPSVTTELTPRQYATLWHTMPDKKRFEKDGLKPTSSLMKIFFLQNHPEVIQKLFGEGVSFDKLQISTMRGMITNMLINRRDKANKLPLFVPAGGDTMSFAGGNVGIEVEEMKQMLRWLGVRESQIHFLDAPMVIHRDTDGREFRIFNVQDFHANLWLINEFINRGHLPENAAYLEFDSKIKYAARSRMPPLPGLRRLGNMEYQVQEVGTKAINIPARQLAEQDLHLGWSWAWDYYDFLKKLLAEYKYKPSNRFFYFPDKGPVGTLVDAIGNHINVVDPTTNLRAAGWTHDEIKEMILAVTCGMTFGVRQRHQEIRASRDDREPIVNYVYGGLVTNDKSAFEIVVQCLEGEVFLVVNMSYAGQAAFLQAMSEAKALDLDNFQLKIAKIIRGFNRDEEYKRWREIQEILDNQA